jgi:hypothetical protein
MIFLIYFPGTYMAALEYMAPTVNVNRKYPAYSTYKIISAPSRIHKRTIFSLMLLGIILEFSDLRFLYGFLKPWGRGYGFPSGFPPFSFTA